MKLSCLQENLARGLSIVSRAVSTRSTLPVLANVLLATDEGRLKLSATNLEIVITCWVGAKIEEEGAITVPARTISDLVNALPQEQVQLQLNSETQTLHLACARTEANIRGIDSQEFPLVPQDDDNPRVRLDPAEFKEMIAQVSFAAATDDARPTLTGIYTHIAPDQIKMASTDGFRLSVRTMEIEEGVADERTLIIPARALIELARVISDSDEYVDLILLQGRSQVIFELETVRLVSQLIEGHFPDFAAVVPESHRTRTVMNTAGFLKACKTAGIFARESGNTARVRITQANELMPGNAVISATSAETGDNVAQIDAVVDGEDIEMNFNVKFITDVLGVISTPQVALETTSTVEPGVLKPVGKDDYVHIIMPMQFGR
jgi:DNA polymerase-3 subunit beta